MERYKALVEINENAAQAMGPNSRTFGGMSK